MKLKLNLLILNVYSSIMVDFYLFICYMILSLKFVFVRSEFFYEFVFYGKFYVHIKIAVRRLTYDLQYLQKWLNINLLAHVKRGGSLCSSISTCLFIYNLLLYDSWRNFFKVTTPEGFNDLKLDQLQVPKKVRKKDWWSRYLHFTKYSSRLSEI